MRIRRDFTYIRGLTLVELLISTAIVLIVLSMAINIYTNAKEQYESLKDRTTTEVKQLATKRLLQDLVDSTGFASKFGFSQQVYHDRTGDSLDSFFLPSGSALRVGKLPIATSNHIAAALEDDCTGECFQAGTDYIMVRSEDNHTKLTANNSLEVSLELESNIDLDANDYLLLSNKDNANLVKIESINSSNGVITLSQSPESSVYYAGDYAGKYKFEIMYIRDTGDQDDEGNAIYSLYIYMKSSSAQGRSYELVRGVDNLQVEYATLDNGVITWNSITTDMNLSSSDYPAIKANFDVDGQTFSKIIIL